MITIRVLKSFLKNFFLNFGIWVLGTNIHMTKKILSFSKTEFVMVPQNHNEFLYFGKDFTTRPKLVQDKLVLKFIRLK
jgi:hypothetical protein